MNIKIIVACHKKSILPSDSIYFPLHVGREGHVSIGLPGDNTGENISAKNCFYSELTGLYWAWKNLECDYIGLVHYRRYFSTHKIFSKASISYALTKNEALQILQHHKIIVPAKRKYYIEKIYTHYSHTFIAEHLNETEKIIAENCPEYLEDFKSVMNQTWGYMFNMFVMKFNFLDEYCQWLFNILFELEKHFDTENMIPFEKRYVGRVGEILFNVWLHYQIRLGKIKRDEIIELPYIYTEQINWPEKIASFLNAKFFHIKYKKSF